MITCQADGSELEFIEIDAASGFFIYRCSQCGAEIRLPEWAFDPVDSATE